MLPDFRRVTYSTKEGIVIWYVLSCKAQEEYRILKVCNTHLSKKAMKKGFVLTYDRMRRYEGAWHLEQKLLFSALIFLESENRNILLEEVGNCSFLRENELFSVNRDEEIFLKKLCGEDGNLGMSEGILHKGVPKITRGPLRGMEERICKIDRHKRLARVEASVFPAETGDGWPEKDLSVRFMQGWRLPYITAGLEITEKTV